MAIDITKLSAEQIKAFKDAGVLNTLVEGAKNDVNAGVPFDRPAYALRPGATNQLGVFGQPGVEPRTYDATTQPRDFTGYLNPMPSNFQETTVGILTGQTATTGTNPDDVCGTPPRTGDLKTCQQLYTYGTMYLGSQKMDITQAGMLYNRGVTERVIMNAVSSDGALVPDILRTSPELINFRSPKAQAQYQLYTATRRALSKVAINGNPSLAPANTEKGFISEFTGLELLIKTGYADVATGVACPAADSDVRTWNAPITSTVNGNSIMQTLTDQYYGRTDIAGQLGIDAQWAYVMRAELFRELTYEYAASYYISRNITFNTTAAVSQTNSEVVRRLQLDMLRGQFLQVDNVQVPVIFSDGITPEAGGGNFLKSSIFLVPMTLNGADGIAFEYKPMNTPEVSALTQHFPGEIEVSNNGLFAFVYNRTNFCTEIVMTAKLRMWLWAPFLAGRIDDVLYTTNTNWRNPYPGETHYVDGGQSSYPV